MIQSATDSYLRKYNYLTRSSLSEYVFSRTSYLKFGFYNYPLAWNSDDHAWLDFSVNKPIYTINESIVFIGLSKLNISGKSDNLVLKSQSQILFYKYLIFNKIKFYDPLQRIIFLRRYENDILKLRKLTYSEWFYLLCYYLKYFEPDEFKKFIKRFLNTILRRHDL